MSNPLPLARRVMIAALVALTLSAVALPAAAPARVPTYDVGDRATFTFTTQEPNARTYGVFLTVASKRRVNRYGGLKRTSVGTFARMVNKGRGTFKYTTPAYTFPDWFMMRPGTYYWQTSITDCSIPGCNILSRIRSFKVV